MTPTPDDRRRHGLINTGIQLMTDRQQAVLSAAQRRDHAKNALNTNHETSLL